MSFRMFIYYCALAGGWAAFLTWVLVQLTGIAAMERVFVKAMLIGGLLGGMVAAAVGLIDAWQHARGLERWVRSVVAGGLGFVGGTIGGFVGQALNYYVGLPAFLGWMLAGVLIGLALGAVDAFQAVRRGTDRRGAYRKLQNGLYGGLLGGLIGGLPFTFLDNVQRLRTSGLTISLVLLGSLIGLMIGLAQVILKDAWLVVVEGFRPGRELSLTKDVTTIGRAEDCDLGLFGDKAVAKLHARILAKNNHYLLAPAADAGETLVNDAPVGANPVPLHAGDSIRIGRSVIRFGERSRSTR